MATTEDYVTLGREGFLALCFAEWGTFADDAPDNPVARALDAERRAIERRHAARPEPDRRRPRCPACGRACDHWHYRHGFPLEWLCEPCNDWAYRMLCPRPSR